MEEELVLDDGTADGGAKLVLDLDRLQQEQRVVRGESLELVVGVKRVEAGRAVVVEGVAVELVGAGLGDGVDDAAGGLAKLGRIAGDGRLELLDGIEREDVGGADRPTARFGKEGLLVIRPVHQVGVVNPGDTTVGDQAGISVGRDVGRKQDEVIPATAVDGEV